MKSVLTLSLADLQSTFREPLFRILIFFPFISFAIVRWVFPLALQYFPVIEPYSQVILMWACLQSATMFGFIYGFIFLEEKEENIWQVIQVLPVSGFKLVTSRLLVGMIITTLVSFVLIHWGGIVRFPVWKEIIVSAHFSLAAPLMALYLASFARNKIEGLAQVKVINILVIIPGIIYFIPHKATYLTGIIPTFWSFKSLEMANASLPQFSMFLIIGTLWYGVVLYLLYRKLKNYQG